MDYWSTLNRLAKQYARIGPLKSQLTAMKDWQASIAAGVLPAHALLGWDLARRKLMPL